MVMLGNFNLFFSSFILGTRLSTNKNLEHVESLHKWLIFTESEFGDYQNIQFVSFLEEIELSLFKQILNDLVKIYKEENPYSTKEDFIEDNFGYTIFSLERFISREYQYMWSPIEEKKYEFYSFHHPIDKEYLIFTCPSGKNIKYFKQYYKKVIETIKSISFEEITITNKDSENTFSGREWAVIFYYYISYYNDSKFDINLLEKFITNYNIDKSKDYLKKCYYQLEKKLHIDNPNPPINIVETILPFIKDNINEIYSKTKSDLEYLKEISTGY